MPDFLDLYDYRRRVAAMYRERAEALQSGEDAALVLQRFRVARNALFATHPQSALDEEQRKQFEGLRYFPYNQALSVTASAETTIEPALLTVAINDEESSTITKVSRLHVTVDGQEDGLWLSWRNMYVVGLILPF